MKVLKYIDLDIDDIDLNDYPDFCDAYICSATAVLEDGSTRGATEDELEELNQDSDTVYSLVMERLY